MKRSLSFIVALIAVAACAAPGPESPATTSTTAATVGPDLLADLSSVEKKLVDLAGAIPEDKYDWRPGEGVRSVREVLLHVASDNYLLPGVLGFKPDPSTGIIAGDFNSGAAFEARKLPRDSVIADLQKSFEFVKKSLQETTAARMVDSVSMFGSSYTGQSAWILTVTHMHEHLGQLIAYARSNGVKPPWS